MEGGWRRRECGRDGGRWRKVIGGEVLIEGILRREGMVRRRWWRARWGWRCKWWREAGWEAGWDGVREERRVWWRRHGEW